MTVEAVTAQEAENKCKDVKDVLLAVAAEQSRQDDDRKPEVRYLEIIQSLLTSGDCKLEPSKTELTKSATSAAIGWFDKEYVYLEPTQTHASVMHLLAKTREPMAAGQNTIHEAMVERGWVIRPNEKGRVAGKASVGPGGKRPRVLKLPVSLFDDVHIDGLYELLHEEEIKAKQERDDLELTAALNEAMDATSGNVEDVSV